MILILAAGQQERWGEYPIKQLLPIGDTTIIERTIKQCRDRGYTPFIVSRRSELVNLAAYFMPPEYQFTCETLLSTSSIWRNQTTILLGDVIYSHVVLDAVLNCQEPIRVFGNLWEIFALSFHDHAKVEKCLHKTVQQAWRGDGKGTLRHFFRLLTGTSENDIEHSWFTKICSINDYTGDIDSPAEYDAFLSQRLHEMLGDDK